MKRGFLFSILLVSVLALTAPAWAQDQGAEASISAHAVTNQKSQDFNNIGLGLQIGYTWRGWHFQGDGIGSDNNPTRARYTIGYLVPYGGLKLEVGGGFSRFGAQNGGFGHVGAKYDRFAGFGRVGSQEFIEAEGSYRLWSKDVFHLSPFFRFTHHDVNQVNVNLYQVGVRFTFSEVQ